MPVPIDFRLLGIVGDTTGVECFISTVSEHASMSFGMMLRDPSHDSDRTRQLCADALKVGVPENLTLISNSLPVDGVRSVHYTAAQLDRLVQEQERVGISTKPFGVSTHSLDQAIDAERLGASYITFSPIFPTASKPEHPGAGLEALQVICRNVRIPVFALGGIDADTASACIDAGAWGVAGISFASPERRATLQQLIHLLGQL
jgi:thiamine-phosphate pyrophosphorylase